MLCKRCRELLLSLPPKEAYSIFPPSGVVPRDWRLRLPARDAHLARIIGVSVMSRSTYRCPRCAAEGRSPEPVAIIEDSSVLTILGEGCTLRPTAPQEVASAPLVLAAWRSRERARFLVDFRNISEYARLHLVGSSSIPWDGLEECIGALPIRQEPIIALLPEGALWPFLLWAKTRNRRVHAASEAGSEFWETAHAKFGDLLTSGGKSVPSWQPAPIVKRALRLMGPQQVPGDGLPPRVFDLGCGSGRDSVYFALHGWRVIAVDRDARALRRAELLAAAEGVSIDTLLADVETPPGMEAVASLPPPDAVLLVRYLHRPLVDWARRHLPPGTKFIMSHFLRGAESVGRCTPKDPDHLLEAGELEARFCEEGWQILVAERNVLAEDGRPVQDFVAVRKSLRLT